MIRHLLSRIGCLMLMVGSFLLILGIAAERSGQPAFNFLLLGVALFFLGFLLWNKLRRKPRQSNRFSLFRRQQRDERGKRDEDDGWGD